MPTARATRGWGVGGIGQGCLQWKKERGLGTNVHRGALCFMGKTWARHKATATVLSNGWRLAVGGGWRLAVGGGWSFRAVLKTKKGGGGLEDSPGIGRRYKGVGGGGGCGGHAVRPGDLLYPCRKLRDFASKLRSPEFEPS